MANKLPILSVYDENGNRIEIPAIIGRSAYQEAVHQGFEGDVDAWLASLTGRGIVSVARTSGTGAAGTTDVYTITYSDGDTDIFTVYNGANGKDGTSVTITGITESTEDGGSNIVTFSDGTSLTVRNGGKGAPGDDYVLTDADKTEIAEQAAGLVDTALLSIIGSGVTE